MKLHFANAPALTGTVSVLIPDGWRGTLQSCVADFASNDPSPQLTFSAEQSTGNSFWKVTSQIPTGGGQVALAAIGAINSADPTSLISTTCLPDCPFEGDALIKCNGGGALPDNFQICYTLTKKG